MKSLPQRPIYQLRTNAPSQFERRDIAEQLIAFDNAFASKFSQKIGDGGLSHEDFFRVFHTGGGFTSGCGSTLITIHDR